MYTQSLVTPFFSVQTAKTRAIRTVCPRTHHTVYVYIPAYQKRDLRHCCSKWPQTSRVTASPQPLPKTAQLWPTTRLSGQRMFRLAAGRQNATNQWKWRKKCGDGREKPRLFSHVYKWQWQCTHVWLLCVYNTSTYTNVWTAAEVRCTVLLRAWLLQMKLSISVQSQSIYSRHINPVSSISYRECHKLLMNSRDGRYGSQPVTHLTMCGTLFTPICHLATLPYTV